MSETEQGRKILEVLQKHIGEELYTKQVAELAQLSASTAAKYLISLKKMD